MSIFWYCLSSLLAATFLFTFMVGRTSPQLLVLALLAGLIAEVVAMQERQDKR